MKKNYLATLFCAAVLALSLISFGCDTQGPAEKAGEKIDKSVESTKDAAGNVADKITGDGPAENAGEKIDEAGNNLKEAVQPKN